MHDRADRILTSIFGRQLSWWQKASSPNDDYDPMGMSLQDRPEGIERQIADREVEDRLKALQRRRVSLKRYTAAQDHPGLTYAPELLPSSERVLSGEQYDAMAKRESTAMNQRRVTEAAIMAKRSDLLVPLKTVTNVEESISIPTASGTKPKA